MATNFVFQKIMRWSHFYLLKSTFQLDNDTLRWRVVGLRAKFSVIQKQKDFEANVGVRLFSFSQARIYERRHKVYYKPLHRRSRIFH